MTVLLVEPGELLEIGVTSLLLSTEALTTLDGDLVQIDATWVASGSRGAAQSVGLLVSNTDTINNGSEISLPGFALRKGLRVMTLVNDKVMAFRNVID